MKKSEIIKKYTELYGKRPTLTLDKNLSSEQIKSVLENTKVLATKQEELSYESEKCYQTGKQSRRA